MRKLGIQLENLVVAINLDDRYDRQLHYDLLHVLTDLTFEYIHRARTPLWFIETLYHQFDQLGVNVESLKGFNVYIHELNTEVFYTLYRHRVTRCQTQLPFEELCRYLGIRIYKGIFDLSQLNQLTVMWGKLDSTSVFEKDFHQWTRTSLEHIVPWR